MIDSNQSDPRPNIFNKRQVSDNICQVLSTSLTRRWGYAQFSPMNAAVPQILSNCRCNLMNYFLLTPGLWNLVPWPPKKPSEILTPGGTLTRSSEAFSIIKIDWLILVLLWSCDMRTPFNAKTTVSRCSYCLMILLQLTLRINPRANSLNTTIFS